MPRYIDADVLLRDIYRNPEGDSGERCAQILEAILSAPTVDVAPRAEVAREIFEEIEKRLAMYSHIHRYAEEAKKVTEEYADGSPVEMTSVWDACLLEHNGYDDYETMCQLQDNIGNIEKSRLLKEFERDIAELKRNTRRKMKHEE
jgi:hypothetical protein